MQTKKERPRPLIKGWKELDFLGAVRVDAGEETIDIVIGHSLAWNRFYVPYSVVT